MQTNTNHSPLFDNLCHCLELLGMNEPLVRTFVDDVSKYAAPKFEVLYNRGGIEYEGGEPCWIIYNVTLRYYFPMPPDCKFIASTDKDRGRLAGGGINEALLKLNQLAACSVSENNKYADCYRGRDFLKKPTKFKFSNKQIMPWFSNTDISGATGDCEWMVAIKFKILGWYDNCICPPVHVKTEM